MVRLQAFAQQAPIRGDRVRLDVMTSAHYEGVWAMISDPTIAALTGTHTLFTEDQVRRWVTTRPQKNDRADWAIVRHCDEAFLGEVVLNELDLSNASANFRIALAAPIYYGRGYGTEAIQLALDYAFNVAQLHRVHLQVYAFNERAQTAYEKCGFTVEGVHRDALKWNGTWYDAISMAVLASDETPSPRSA